MKRTMKWFSRLAAALLIVMLLAGCGAEVTTRMTVDQNFAGSREITLTLGNGDLDEISGGFAALENVIKENLPAELTYSSSEGEDSKIMLFTLSYTSLEDYRTKVAALINAGVTEEEKADEDYEPFVADIAYEKNDTVFKKGIYFTENFNSVDLLDWLREALRVANIINESESDWYEVGNNVVIIEGTEYDRGTSYFSVDDVKRTCLDNATVTTTILTDGTFEREIALFATGEHIDAINEKMQEDKIKLDAYLKKLTPEGDTFEVVLPETEEGEEPSEEADENEEKITPDTTYLFTIKAATADELVKKTNQILQTKTNKFAVSATPKKDKKGMADLKITEVLDASYYLDYSYSNSPVTSIIDPYYNTSGYTIKAGEKSEELDNEGRIVYYPASTQTYEISMNWKVSFETIEFKAFATSLKKLKAELVFTLPEKMADPLKNTAKALVKDAATKGGEYKEDGDVVTVSFSGTIEEVVKQINCMIGSQVKDYKYKPLTMSNQDDPDRVPYFSVELMKFNTASKFTGGVTGAVNYDFSPLLGNAVLQVADETGFFGDHYYSITADEDGKQIAGSEGFLVFYDVRLSILVVILAIIFVLLLVAGVVFGLLNRAQATAFFATLKQNKAAKAAAVAGQPVADIPAPPAAPAAVAEPVAAAPAEPIAVQTSPTVEAPAEPVAPVAPAPAVQTEEEEEEML